MTEGEELSLSEIFHRLFEKCLFYGMRPSEYWDLTMGEIISFIKAAEQRLEWECKRQDTLSYNVASMTATFAAMAINGNRIPSYAECFSSSDGRQSEALIKEKLLDFATMANENRRSK